MDDRYKKFFEYNEAAQQKKVEACKKLEEYIENKKNEWAEKLNSLISRTKRANPLQLIEIEMDSLSLHHEAVEEINDFVNKVIKMYALKEESARDRIIFYNFRYQASDKLRASEKDQYLAADLSEDTKWIQLAEGYIEFLRDMKNECQSIKFAIKNRIQVHSLLGDV